MAFDLTNKMVIGVASSALFNLDESHKLFLEEGVEKYRNYQSENVDVPLLPGVAFNFVKRLLNLNDLRPQDPLVEVVVMSRNSPETGIRVMNSVEHYELPITRAIFRSGRSPHKFIEALELCLYLSGHEEDVRAALQNNYPAGLVVGTESPLGIEDEQLTIAFDFDSVLASDSSEKIYQTTGDIDAFKEHESIKREEPLDPGPLHFLLTKLNEIQELEKLQHLVSPEYVSRVRIVLVTARNAPAHERAINTIRSWGLNVDEAFFLGGIEKSKVLNVIQPHIFFDDQETHFVNLKNVAAVHIPFGITNRLAGVKD